MLIALCQSTCSCSCRCSTYHHHEKNEASYAVWLSCSKYADYSLSEWLICISSYTSFTRMDCSSKSERAQTKNIMETAHPRGGGGGLATQFPPWISPWPLPKLSLTHLKVTFAYMHCIMKLVVLTTEWLPWLLTNWRGNSWEVQTNNPRTSFGAL